MTAEAPAPVIEPVPVTAPESPGAVARPASAHRKRKGPKPRHIPQRTCIITRQTEDKRKLVRLVRTPEGHVEVDTTGKRNGRGAYLVADRAVWEKALGSNALARALKVEIPSEDIVTLRSYAEALPTDPALAPHPGPTGRSSRSPAPTVGTPETL